MDKKQMIFFIISLIILSFSVSAECSYLGVATDITGVPGENTTQEFTVLAYDGFNVSSCSVYYPDTGTEIFFSNFSSLGAVAITQSYYLVLTGGINTETLSCEYVNATDSTDLASECFERKIAIVDNSSYNMQKSLLPIILFAVILLLFIGFSAKVYMDVKEGKASKTSIAIYSMFLFIVLYIAFELLRSYFV